MNDSGETDRLRAALRDAEQRLQAVVDVAGPQTGTLVFELRDDDRLVFAAADATAGQLLTVAGEDYFGKPVLEVFTGMASTDLPAALAEAAREGKAIGVRSFIPPGTRLSRVFSFFAFQAAPRRVVLKFWESSHQPETQEIARRNQELLARVFEQSPVAIALVRDAGAMILDVNAEWTRLTGFSRAEVLGHSARDVGFWRDSASRDRVVLALRSQGQVHDQHLSFITKDGRAVDFSLHGSAIQIGGERHFLIYLLDVTARHQAEAELRRLNAELESRVEQRTAELAHASNEAERANRSKSDFLSGMSHELRTPMNAILGFGQLLEADPAQPLSAQQHGYVRQILHAGTHLLELINEVLDLARIEAGKLQISLERVGVAALIDDCLGLLQPVAREYGIELIQAAPPACDCHVNADRTRAKQVLLNLLSNAIKYNRERGRVWVACEADADSVRIGVSDSGPGLSAEQQQRLFRDFERLGADSAAIEGTGIGLALSRRLAMMMHGDIAVDSAVGQGSTFWLRLQRVTAPALPAPPAASAGPLAGARAVAAGPHKVLYVEDNPVNVVLMEAILAHRPGVRLITAPLPILGLDMARAERPDLILLDIQLPGMDGYELLRRLRQRASTRDIPAVAISANAMPADVARGLAAGFASYLTKPLDVQLVLRTVDELLPP